ncbi:MAG TPA: YMGG-like glycine zipper-containing protein [Pyrinomonadaceae bacterium]
MNRIKQIFSLALVFAFAALSMTVAQAQRRPYRATDQQVRQLISRIESRTDIFRGSLDSALNRSRVDSTRTEDDINQFVRDFENATDQLRDRFNRRQSVSADVQNVLDRAALIDSFMRRNRLGARAERDWASLRVDLNELARTYGVSWRWDNTTYPTNNYPTGNYPSNNYPPVNNASNRLTGTYQLDPTRSDDARAVADRAVRTLSYRDRQRILDSLTARLESPTAIAIDRRGRSVTIASSRAQQFTFEADGIERTETGTNGRTVRVRSALNGDQLIVTSTGDRGNDFSVTFDPIEGGRRLRVTRRITDINLSTPLVVESIYNKTSEVAQLDLYNGGPGYSSTGTVATSGDFVIPDGTQVVAVLNNNLTTRDTRDNDRFSMTVRSPYQYEGATINGYVTNISRSGRITGRSEMTLNFESITLRNGQTYRFAGITEAVRTADGDTIRVDNEGAVRDSSRTSTTGKRAAIGTAVGAIIGAIAGGGKGAAIGAIIGAGAGAGSVYIQGKDDLELISGTELTIRASGPR